MLMAEVYKALIKSFSASGSCVNDYFSLSSLFTREMIEFQSCNKVPEYGYAYAIKRKKKLVWPFFVSVKISEIFGVLRTQEVNYSSPSS